jgi:CRISPR-associated protein Cmr2
MSVQHLFLFQIGPVQSFIAAARRTQDLYVGSRLLSAIAAAGVREASEQGADILFPALDANGNPPPGTPHRFAFLSSDDPRRTATRIEEALRDQWTAYANAVRGWLINQLGSETAYYPPREVQYADSWTTVFDQQIERWLEVHWVAVPYENQHGDAFKQASRTLAARREARDFRQVEELEAAAIPFGRGSAAR